MSTPLRTLSSLLLAAASLTLGASAWAQSGRGTGSTYDGSSWYSPSGGRYIGFNAGRSDYPGPGTGDAYALYTGGTWGQNFGMEFGARDFGRSNGLDAYGFSLSAVARLPLNEVFAVYGKLGGIYGRTKNAAGAKDTGWGETYGVGVDFNLTSKLSALLEYDRSRLDFVGGRDHINVTSVGLKYRY